MVALLAIAPDHRLPQGRPRRGPGPLPGRPDRHRGRRLGDLAVARPSRRSSARWRPSSPAPPAPARASTPSAARSDRRRPIVLSATASSTRVGEAVVFEARGSAQGSWGYLAVIRGLALADVTGPYNAVLPGRSERGARECRIDVQGRSTTRLLKTTTASRSMIARSPAAGAIRRGVSRSAISRIGSGRPAARY